MESAQGGSTPGGSFRTLETPGAVVPDIVPAPWSFHPGLPDGTEVVAANFSETGFTLDMRTLDGTSGCIRTRAVEAGRLAGVTDLPAKPSLFSPAQETTEDEGAWILEGPDHRAVLVAQPGGGALRFGLAWGAEAAESLRSAAGHLLETDFPPLHDAARPTRTAAAGEEQAKDVPGPPSAGAEMLHRHGGKILAAVAVFVCVLIIWGVADSPGTGDHDEAALFSLAVRLYSDGRHDEALAVLEQAEVRMEPGMADLLRGQLLYRRGRYEEAAESYQQARERGAAPNAAMLNQAVCLYRDGQVAKAISTYEDFIDTHGEKNPALTAKATAALEVLRELEGTLPPKNVGH